MKLNALAGESISEASIVCMVLSPPLFSATLSVLSFLERMFSVAAVRLGFIAGNEKLVKYVWNVRPTFDTNAVALKFGEVLLTEPGLCEKLVAIEKEGRKYLTESLGEHGYEYFAENGNYAFIRPKTSVSQVKERLEEKRILIKTYNQEILKGYIRISTGSKKIMKQFTEALYEVDR